MTQPATGVADAAAHPAQVAGTGVPTLLDMAASTATEGLAQRTLLDVCMDLFAKLAGVHRLLLRNAGEAG